MRVAKSRGRKIKTSISVAFRRPYDRHVKPFSTLAKKINQEIDRLFAKDIQILLPGRSSWPFMATSIAPHYRQSGSRWKTRYYIDLLQNYIVQRHHFRSPPKFISTHSKKAKRRCAR